MKLERCLAAVLILHAMGLYPARADDGPAYLVADLEPAVQAPFVAPDGFELDGLLYFAGTTEVTGRELYRTDGTAEGTELVADVCKGRCLALSRTPPPLAELDGARYFPACTGHSCQLWKLEDGEIKAIYDAGGNGYYSDVTDVAAWNGALYFTTVDGELRRSDGDGPGTVLARIEGYRRPGKLLPTDGALFFVAYGYDTGIIDPPIAPPAQLWTSDGTADGTFPIWDGIRYAFPRPPYALVPGAVFPSWVEGEGERLFATDGDSVERLFGPPLFNAPFKPLALDDGALFLSAYGEDSRTEIWRTDGTAAGTSLVARANGSHNDIRLVTYDGEPYFWEYRESRKVLRKIPRDGSGAVPFFEFPDQIWTARASGDSLLISTAALTGGPKSLWRTRGTPESTVQLLSLGGRETLSFFAELGGEAVIRLESDRDDDLPWTLQGTLAGVAGEEAFALFDEEGVSSDPRGFTAAGKSAYFLADDPEAGERARLWGSDGTPAGTAAFSDVEESSRLMGVGDKVLVFEEQRVLAFDEDGGMDVLLRADDSGVRFLTDPVLPLGGDVLFLETRSLPSFVNLWRTDGTAAGTTMVWPRIYDFGFFGSPGAYDGAVRGSEAFLLVVDTIWRTDGTRDGTVLVADLAEACPECFLDNLAVTDDRIFFTSREPYDDAVRRLWRVDASTGEAAAIFETRGVDVGGFFGPAAPALRDLTAAGDRLFFVLTDPSVGAVPVLPAPQVAEGAELWTSDGTAEGTRLVRDIWPGRSSSNPRWLTDFDGRLVFTADDGESGRELWTSDGTAEGTVLFHDVYPGPSPAQPHGLRVVDGVLLFAADGGSGGTELWASDASGADVRQVQDLNPGPLGSDPRGFTAAGECVYFNAGRRETGFELWALHVSALHDSSPTCPECARALCGLGRFKKPSKPFQALGR